MMKWIGRWALGTAVFFGMTYGVASLLCLFAKLFIFSYQSYGIYAVTALAAFFASSVMGAMYASDTDFHDAYNASEEVD